MFSVADLLERAKARGNIDTDYRLSKVIAIKQSALSNYRAGRSMPDDRVLEQLCALSGDDLGVVAAQIQAERARTPDSKNMWLMIAKRLAGGASTAVLSVVFAISLIAGYAQPAGAAALKHVQTAKVDFLYIVSTTFLSVGTFVERRSRQISGFFWLCRLFV
jgi:hypothetical protein